MRKSAWLLSAGLIAISCPAQAQDATPTPETDTDYTGAEATQGATAEGAAVARTTVEPDLESAGNGVIVVTATRRNQALSDVPLAVSAVTSEQLELTGASDIRQIQQVSPSLMVSSTTSEAGAGVARIRGIGTVGDNPGLESSVALFIDGVYRSRTGVGLTELGPIDRVEVLRGPQGTLFGRNASAGLISIITAKPLFTPMVGGEISIGNYDMRRLEGSVTGPIGSDFAARLDGVYLKRDGFLEDVVSGRDVNDRNRWILRGQGLYEPTDDLSVRIIGDYSKRDEECCAAPFLPARDYNAPGGEGPSTIAAIENALGGMIQDDPYERRVSITPGRSYASDVEDYGLSGEVVYDFGGAELTSISAYRYNNYVRGQDADFNALDILYRDDDGGSYNRFKTMSQEVRLQGEAMGGRLDWLVGGYYANEKLRVVDNLAYGDDYDRYANCLVANNFADSPLVPDSIVAAGVSPTCFNEAVATGTRNALIGLFNQAAMAGDLATAQALAGQITTLGAFARLDNSGFAPAPINFSAPFFTNAGFTNLAMGASGGALAPTLVGTAVDDLYDQTSNNFALFTHNIFEVTDGLNLTLGLRYTREKKTLEADLRDVGGSSCAFYGTGGALGSLQQVPCVIPSLPGGAFTGEESFTESKLSGTAVLSYKLGDGVLTYASYSRGYKAGGFNLDRSALSRYVALNASGVPVAGAVTPTAGLGDLVFRPEINDAVELGVKYDGAGIDINVAAFHQLFTDFQLNTFNGINFFVENINACEDELNGADEDNDSTTGACTGGTKAGVKSMGVELEVFTRPLPNVSFNFGTVYADTRYRDNLVGAEGRALSNALFQLPGRRLSNSSEWTVTSSLAWTPPIGGTGLNGLFYVDARHMTAFNTGSDLDIEKMQDGFTVVNARVGINGPDRSWGLELWAQNLFDEDFSQVAFDGPLQGTCTVRGAQQGFCSPVANRSTQLFGAFLGEPRTYGLTLRGRF